MKDRNKCLERRQRKKEGTEAQRDSGSLKVKLDY